MAQLGHKWCFDTTNPEPVQENCFLVKWLQIWYQIWLMIIKWQDTPGENGGVKCAWNHVFLLSKTLKKKTCFWRPQFLSHLQHQGWFPTGAKSCGTTAQKTCHLHKIKEKKTRLLLVHQHLTRWTLHQTLLLGEILIFQQEIYISTEASTRILGYPR